MGKIPLNECPSNDTKPYDDETPVLVLWEMWNTPTLLQDPLSDWSESTCYGPIEKFNYLLYLKPFNCANK